jgi:hypothetical protein
LETFGIFHRHFEYLVVNWYILLTFVIFYGHLVHIFFPFWFVALIKIWQPCTRQMIAYTTSYGFVRVVLQV